MLGRKETKGNAQILTRNASRRYVLLGRERHVTRVTGAFYSRFYQFFLPFSMFKFDFDIEDAEDADFTSADSSNTPAESGAIDNQQHFVEISLSHLVRQNQFTVFSHRIAYFLFMNTYRNTSLTHYPLSSRTLR